MVCGIGPICVGYRADGGYNQKEDWEQGELITKGIINGQNPWNPFVANSAVAATATAAAVAAVNHPDPDQSVMTAT